PVPRWIARLMLSAGMFADFAASTAARRRGFDSGSPPPFFAATVISLMIFVNRRPRLASAAPFLCLIVDHLLWPDIGTDSFSLGKLSAFENDGKERPIIRSIPARAPAARPPSGDSVYNPPLP